MKVNLLKEKTVSGGGDLQLLSILEAAKLLRLSPFTVRLFIQRGELPIIRLGRRVLIHSNDLGEFIRVRREVRGKGSPVAVADQILDQIKR